MKDSIAEALGDPVDEGGQRAGAPHLGGSRLGAAVRAAEAGLELLQRPGALGGVGGGRAAGLGRVVGVVGAVGVAPPGVWVAGAAVPVAVPAAAAVPVGVAVAVPPAEAGDGVDDGVDDDAADAVAVGPAGAVTVGGAWGVGVGGTVVLRGAGVGP